MNNLIKTFKDDKEVSYNKNHHNFSYIVQFDKFGEKILNELLEHNNSSQKIIVGPLYSLKNLQSLVAKKINNKQIRILAASDSAKSNLIHDFDLNIHPEDVVVCPGGVISNKDLLKNAGISDRTDECLIYFKKRSVEDLTFITNELRKKNIKYQIFEYGRYKNKSLLQASKNCKFGIIIGSTESQGFGVQEILSCNLPVIVLNSNKNKFEGYTLRGTTVPYWSDDCGIVIENLNDFNKVFDSFYSNLTNYQPYKLIEKHLTFEKSREKLLSLFKTIND